MPSQAAFALVAAIIHGGMAVLVLTLRRKTRVHWAFLRLELGLFVWNAGLAGSLLAGHDVLWLKLMYGGVATLAPSAALFAGRFLGWSRLAIRAAVIPSLAGAAAFLVWLLATDMTVLETGRHVLSRGQRDLLVAYTFPLLMICSVGVLWRGLRAPTRLMKRTYLHLGGGSAVAIAAGLTDFLPSYGWPIPPLGNLVIATYGILLYLTVVRTGLLRVRLFIRRFLVAAGCLLLLGALYGVASRHLEGDVWFPSALATALILLAGFSLLREDSAISRPVRRLLGEGPRFAEVVAAADAELPRAEDAADLAGRVLAILKRAFPVEAAALLFRERSGALAPPVRQGMGLPASYPEVDSGGLPNPSLREELAFQSAAEDTGSRRRLLDWMEAEGVDAIHWLNGGERGALLVRFCDRAEVSLEEFAEVCRVLGDRLLAHAEILAARAEVERTKRLAALGRMAAAMAHEIRNPLAAMHSSAQFLEGEPLSDEARACARGLREETERLNQTITHLLRYARPPAFQPTPAEINATIERIVDAVRPGMEGLEIEVRRSPDGVTLPLDAGHLRQILLNLLLNARDYATRAVVSVERRPNLVRIAVRDNGPGVPAAIRESLFEPFCTTRSQGTGLGLAISRGLAEAHGGSLTLAEPEHDAGPGACFVIELPMRQEHGETDGVSRGV